MHEVSADDKTSFAIMNRALEAGINFIDTADVYGQDGFSKRAIGCSNYAGYRMSESWWLSELHQWNKFVTLQAHYSLVPRDLEREHVPFCRSKGMGILPWSPPSSRPAARKCR